GGFRRRRAGVGAGGARRFPFGVGIGGARADSLRGQDRQGIPSDRSRLPPLDRTRANGQFVQGAGVDASGLGRARGVWQMIELASLSLPGIRHGFFTRAGGVSAGVYASLNCGFGAKDDAALVSENRARAMKYLHLAPSALATAKQVHGAEAVV